MRDIMEQYDIKPQENYAVFTVGKESNYFKRALTKTSPKGLVSGKQLTDLLNEWNLDISLEPGGHLSIQNKDKKEVARVVPLIA